MVIWNRPERGARGPAPEYSRAQIASAGVTLADAGGLADLSMRQVAAALRTGPASLYRYVGSRDDLIDLMADAVIGEIDLTAPITSDWRADVITLAADAKGVYLRHTWLLDVVAQRTPVGPRAIDYLERSLQLLEPVEVADRVKLETIGLISGLVALFARNEINDSHPRPDSAAYLGQAAADGAHPRLLAAVTAPDSPEPVTPLFDRILGHVLSAMR